MTTLALAPPPRGCRWVEVEGRTFLSRGHRVIAFIEGYCVHGDGDYYGQPFRLDGWQKALLYKLFEARPDGTPRYRRALIGLPKGNGKTELVAALGVYMLVGDDTTVSPLIPVAAASKEQAGLVFGAARVMCQESKRLAQLTEAGADVITLRGRPGRLYRVAAADGTNDGQRPSCFIADELHEWAETKNVFTVLSNGTAKRSHSLQLYITTAGHDLDTICGRLYQYGRRVNAGEVADDEFFFWWLEPGEGDDITDPEVWRRVNPAADRFWPAANLERQFRTVPESVFRRYHLNQWVEAEELWLPQGAWEACGGEPFAYQEGEPLFAALDAATKEDSTAIVTGQWQEGRLLLRARIWERPVDVAGNPVQGWSLPWAEVENHLRELHRRFKLRTAFDPKFAVRSMKVLEDEGLDVEEFPQSDQRMVPACQSFYRLVVEGAVRHEDDSAFTRHVKAAVAKEAYSGGWRLKKGGQKKKMDAAIAAAMCVSLATAPEEADPVPFLWVPGED